MDRRENMDRRDDMDRRGNMKSGRIRIGGKIWKMGLL